MVLGAPAPGMATAVRGESTAASAAGVPGPLQPAPCGDAVAWPGLSDLLLSERSMPCMLCLGASRAACVSSDARLGVVPVMMLGGGLDRKLPPATGGFVIEVRRELEVRATLLARFLAPASADAVSDDGATGIDDLSDGLTSGPSCRV